MASQAQTLLAVIAGSTRRKVNYWITKAAISNLYPMYSDESLGISFGMLDCNIYEYPAINEIAMLNYSISAFEYSPESAFDGSITLVEPMMVNYAFSDFSFEHIERISYKSTAVEVFYIIPTFTNFEFAKINVTAKSNDSAIISITVEDIT